MCRSHASHMGVTCKSCDALLHSSLLSHSAVVARELGLPTIVGVSGGLMKRLKVCPSVCLSVCLSVCVTNTSFLFTQTGMRVHMDAGKVITL